MHRRVLVLVLMVVCFGFSAMANAGTVSFGDFNGTGSYSDPGPFPTYTIGNFNVAAGNDTITLNGTFGNATVNSTAGVDLFAGNMTDGFYLFAQCFEYDSCWTGPTQPFSGTVTGNFVGGTWTLFASQTSQYVVRLGDLTVTGNVTSAPEPSSLMLLGSGLLGAVGVIRRKFRG